MNVFMVRSGHGEFAQSFVDNNYVGIGWFNDFPDCHKWNFYDKNFIAKKYLELNPDKNRNQVGVQVGQITRFANDIKPGDFVLTTFPDKSLAVGLVVGSLL